MVATNAQSLPSVKPPAKVNNSVSLSWSSHLLRRWQQTYYWPTLGGSDAVSVVCIIEAASVLLWSMMIYGRFHAKVTLMNCLTPFLSVRRRAWVFRGS